jgi:hypothetical protein
VRRLDKQQGSRQYQDFEARLRRLGQRATIQMMERSLHASSSEEDGVSFDGRDLADVILEEAATIFGELTEQDNALEYMEAAVDFEAECAEEEMRQANKMLLRLEGDQGERMLSRKEDFKENIKASEAQLKVSGLLKRELARAKTTLRSIHGQEIEDGYNLIPKATELFASLVGKKAKNFENTEARQISRLYQKALCAKNLVDVMDVTHNVDKGDTFEAKNVKSNLKAMLELSGSDIGSVNPSREVSHLVTVRNMLFNTEIALQMYDTVGKLKENINANFSECAKKSFGESEQYTTTRNLAKLSQQSSVSSAQIWDILELLGVDGGQ